MDRGKAIERARKLMAMAADSSSPNEAAIAAKRARSIIDKFQIESSELNEASEFGSASAGKPRYKIPLWEQTMAIGIAQLNDCVAHIEGGCFQFNGFAEDAEVASFMLLYIVENGKRTCSAFMKEHKQGCRQSFKMAYAGAIREKVEAMIEARKKEVTTADGTSLVVIKKQLVEKEFGAERYRDVKRGYDFDLGSSLAGRKAGESTNIVTGLKDNDLQKVSN